MLKWLVILAVVFVVNPTKKNQSPDLSEHDGNNDRPQSVSFVNNETAYPEKRASDTKPPHWYTSPEVWLCVLTVPMVAFIGWQAKETRNAAGAAKESAEAARQNAEFLVNSERPWLIAEVIKAPHIPHTYSIQITNYGKSPARFISGDATHIVVERADELATPPMYSSPIVLPAQLLIAPEKGFVIPHPYSVPDLLVEDKTLVIYGRILYEDTIIPGVHHETRWCFGYIKAVSYGGDFVLIGPTEYTKYT